jgi:hypothetical protein
MAITASADQVPVNSTHSTLLRHTGRLLHRFGELLLPVGRLWIVLSDAPAAPPSERPSAGTRLIGVSEMRAGRVPAP